MSWHWRIQKRYQASDGRPLVNFLIGLLALCLSAPTVVLAQSTSGDGQNPVNLAVQVYLPLVTNVTPTDGVDQQAVDLDANLVDSDIFDSRVNMEGFAVQAGYAISDAVTFNLTYGYGRQNDRDLGTGGVGDAFSLNPLRKYNIFQADLSVKF